MKMLTKRQILLLHQQLIEQTGGSDGIRDEGLLDSAMAAPFQSFDNTDVYSSLQQKAARLCLLNERDEIFSLAMDALVSLHERNYQFTTPTDTQHLIERNLFLMPTTSSPRKTTPKATRTALWASIRPPTSTMSGGMSSTGDTKAMCWWTASPGCRSTS